MENYKNYKFEVITECNSLGINNKITNIEVLGE